MSSDPRTKAYVERRTKEGLTTAAVPPFGRREPPPLATCCEAHAPTPTAPTPVMTWAEVRRETALRSRGTAALMPECSPVGARQCQ